MNKASSFCLLLLEEDEQIVNRFAAIAGEVCSITSFRNVREAEGWLAGSPELDLIIADKNSESAIVTIARHNHNWQSVPVLISLRFVENHLINSALVPGVTDILALGEDDHRLQSKMRYYMTLKQRVLLSRQEAIPPTFHEFKLPWWKRSIDIAISLTVLVALSPLLLVVALLIVLDSKGPVLYKSKRAGANFRVFNMHKFRTMKAQADQQIKDLAAHNIYATAPVDSVAGSTGNYLCSACRQQGIACQQLLFDQNQPICEKLYLQENEESAKFMKFRNDPRITRLGSFLRNSSIDELPQLFNVLLGDMSLVGNRPLPLYEAEKLTSEESIKRFAGPAGLTGIWQIKKRAKGQGPMSDRERILLDIEYSSTFSFRTDTYIMWRTFFSLWQKENV